MTASMSALCHVLGEEVRRPVPPWVDAVVDAIRLRHGKSIVAVLFHGSCMRMDADVASPEDGVLDLYVLVDRYRDFYGRRGLAALANAALPPNVFYVETPTEAGVARAKYAVISLTRFRRDTTGAALHPSVWARFCQPARLVYVRDQSTRRVVIEALARAVITMVGESAPLLEGEFSAADLWQRAFRETYRTELRVEGAGRARQIHDFDAAHYALLSEPALGAAGLEPERTDVGFRIACSRARRARCRVAWVARRWIGKPLTMARLIKGAFTFAGAVDYILWKIERHSGVRPNVTAWQRRHPILASPVLVWRLYRRGVLR